ncbi:MAG: DUF1285 domain-containing protein [Myxococcales bacterium]|nr:DUF1285 domain-containing protein [Myxococcota bacterium]MDW8280067.1 DUF1285 domain-containing protein [Myxococcales bacterium]
MSAPGDPAQPPSPEGGVETIDPTLPEVVRRLLAAGATLEPIVLDAEGQWLHQGQPFTNERVRQLFHRSIDRTPGGTWVLHIPPFTYPIQVEDTPYHVRSLHMVGQGPQERVVLHLSDASEEDLVPATLRLVAGRLYCAVKGGRFQARFNRPAYYALLERLEEHDGQYWLRLAGQLVPLAVSEAP